MAAVRAERNVLSSAAEYNIDYARNYDKYEEKDCQENLNVFETWLIPWSCRGCFAMWTYSSGIGDYPHASGRWNLQHHVDLLT